ncbi:MAG: hypothetical protein ABJL99_20905 [Aliishimia sp.]
MTSFVIKFLPKSLHYAYFEYGRGLLLALVGVIAVVAFIAIYESGADDIEGYTRLPVTSMTEQVGANQSAEWAYTVTTPAGDSVILLTQSASVVNQTDLEICAEQRRSKDGTLFFEAALAHMCDETR